MNNIKTGRDRRQAIVDAERMGYVIHLDKRGNSVYVTFSGRTVNDYKLRHSYASDITDEDIKQDCVYDLFKWAGVQYETKLTMRV